MKHWVLLSCLFLSHLSIADLPVYKKSIGKPRVDAYLMDSSVIRVLPDQLHAVDIKIKYSADTLGYVLYASDGLIINETPSSADGDDDSGGILTIPVQIKVNRQGRFYIHIELTTEKDGVQTKGIISQVVSSESTDKAQTVQQKSQLGSIKILPSIETIKNNTNE